MTIWRGTIATAYASFLPKFTSSSSGSGHLMNCLNAEVDRFSLAPSQGFAICSFCFVQGFSRQRISTSVYTKHPWHALWWYIVYRFHFSSLLSCASEVEELKGWPAFQTRVDSEHVRTMYYFHKIAQSRPCVYMPPLFLTCGPWGNDYKSRTETVFWKTKKVAQRSRKKKNVRETKKNMKTFLLSGNPNIYTRNQRKDND